VLSSFAALLSDQQAREINNFKNTKKKLLRANATMWFNKLQQRSKRRQHNEPLSRKNIGALPEDDVVKRRNMSE
jgi:hypothetical protein